jgi:hypothetical protein
LITPDHKAGLIAGHQLNDLMRTDRGRVMHNVVVMKEAVLDFAKRHRLRLPTWWADTCDAAPSATYDTTAELVNKSEPRSLGKQPRIIKYLMENYPNGVPPPGLAPRKALKAALIRTQRPQKQNERLSGNARTRRGVEPTAANFFNDPTVHWKQPWWSPGAAHYAHKFPLILPGLAGAKRGWLFAPNTRYVALQRQVLLAARPGCEDGKATRMPRRAGCKRRAGSWHNTPDGGASGRVMLKPIIV